MGKFGIEKICSNFYPFLAPLQRSTTDIYNKQQHCTETLDLYKYIREQTNFCCCFLKTVG